jgi:malate synthase
MWFSGKAQIGKGMWAMPDKMKEMMEQKIRTFKSWSKLCLGSFPTAAALHALHYHRNKYFDEQKEIEIEKQQN